MKIKVYPTPSKKLREALENEGFRFPCGGKGVCGRCKIVAPMLAPTELDYRFFTAKDIAEGLRLACDKTIDNPIEIDSFMQQIPAPRKLSEAMITAILGDRVSEISIVEDGIVETLVVSSPEADTVKLRSLVGKQSIELFEKYGVPKATVMLVAGTAARMRAFCGKSFDTEDGFLQMGDTLEASKFDMPAEEVYLPPFPNATTGSLELLELDDLPDNSLLLLAEHGYQFFYKGESVIATAQLTEDADCANTAFAATVRYFCETYQPTAIYEVGTLPKEIADYLNKAECSWEHKESAATARAARAVEDNRYKTRLNKWSRKIVLLHLADEERWQELFSLSQQTE